MLGMVKISLKLLKKEVEKALGKAGTQEELKAVSKRFLGKQGEIVLLLRSLKRFPKTKRKAVGKTANDLKNLITQKIEEKNKKIQSNRGGSERIGWLDITAPGEKLAFGHFHPLTQARRDVEEIFENMGFSVVEGPEMESEWYNFDALNIPKDHPARDAWDTFYLKNGLLLRTHTSPVQVRYLEKNNPPLRIIVPGPVFRHEATDPSHEFELIQVEGLMVDKKVSVANFKAIIEEFFRRFFKKDVKSRLRPDFFPFTEPSFDVSITCVVCNGKGCPTCKNSGWVELAGAGMVHPNVFKNSGLIPKDWQGWAFGFGLERLAMMKYKINDIRLFRSGDLRFLNQF